MSDTTTPDITGYSFEQAMTELERIVKRLEAGSTDLESALADYARGSALQLHCQRRLEEARMKVEAVMRAQDGTPALQPFEEG
ncbi:MAG: exodeoxyribonuclease VII small subunit [Alphaproteobacteria bacterium]|nr:exodeoxyribonuclease VII small subunit [Alphaproteobacteria bacterium]